MAPWKRAKNALLYSTLSYASPPLKSSTTQKLRAGGLGKVVAEDKKSSQARLSVQSMDTDVVHMLYVKKKNRCADRPLAQAKKENQAIGMKTTFASALFFATTMSR